MISELDTVTKAAIVLADELAHAETKAERERRAVVAYLRRMADLWGGTSKEPSELLRGCARYVEGGGHLEEW